MDDKQFLSQLFADIATADVLTIFFPAIHKALVIDTRRVGSSGPYITVAPAVGSIEERLAMVHREHPELGVVSAILSIPWIKSVLAFRDQDVLDRLAARLGAAGMAREDAHAACRAALTRLLEAERQATIDLLRGKGYRSIWPPEPGD